MVKETGWRPRHSLSNKACSKVQTDKTPPSQGVSPAGYMMQQQKRKPSQRNQLIQENDFITQKTCKVSEL